MYFAEFFYGRMCGAHAVLLLFSVTFVGFFMFFYVFYQK